MYFALICVTLVLLFGVNRMERRLDGAVAEHNLRFTGQIKNAPPLVTFRYPENSPRLAETH